MNWFDPIDCRQARDLIAQQQHSAAAKLLLNSPDREHRAARKLLADLLPKLVDEARLLWEQQAIAVAKDRIDLAAQCGALTGEQQQLLDVIHAEWSRQQQQLEHEQQRLQRAKNWAAEGRIVSALGLVNSLEGTTAELAKQDWDEQRLRFERYLDDAANYIEQHAYAAARDRLDRARAIQAVHPQLVEVELSYRAAVGIRGQAPQNSKWAGQGSDGNHDSRPPILNSAVPDPGRTGHSSNMPNRLLLNETLLATGHELVIGNPHGEGVTIPLLANVHRRHAVVVRHRRGHQLLAMPGCETRRNGELVNGACELVPGDVLQFGSSACQWKSLRPIHDSLSVVFEPMASTTTDIRLPDGSSCRRVVWWDDGLVLAARTTTPAHIIVSELPIPELRLLRQPQGFTVAASTAELSLEHGSDEIPITHEVLSPPCRLIVRVERSESDILQQQFVHRGREMVSDHCVLDFQVV